MSQHGSLRVIEEVKLLILYILNIAKKPLTKTEITDVILQKSLCEYFILPDSYAELIATDHIVEYKEGEKQLVYITKLGSETIDELYKQIPLYVRSKAQIGVMDMLQIIGREAQIKTELSPIEGGYIAKAIIKENINLMEISLFVANDMQGDLILENFKKHPEKIYKGIIDILTQIDD